MPLGRLSSSKQESPMAVRSLLAATARTQGVQRRRSISAEIRRHLDCSSCEGAWDQKSLRWELEQLTPVPDKDFKSVAERLANFASHWKRLEGDEDGRHELIRPIVERVFVQDDQVVAMTLHSNYHVILCHKVNGPTEVMIDPFVYRHGSDGSQGRRGPDSVFSASECAAPMRVKPACDWPMPKDWRWG